MPNEAVEATGTVRADCANVAIIQREAAPGLRPGRHRPAAGGDEPNRRPAHAAFRFAAEALSAIPGADARTDPAVGSIPPRRGALAGRMRAPHTLPLPAG